MATPTLIASTASGTNNSGTTTSAIDTTGATLIVIAVNYYSINTSVTDSKSNVWNSITSYTAASKNSTRLYYCINPIVGSGHTFTLSEPGSYPNIGVCAFGGGYFQYQQETGQRTDTTSTSYQPGSLTPTSDNCVLVSSIGTSGTSISINSSFTATTVNNSPGNYIGGGIAYKIQTTAGAENPTWSWTTSSSPASALAVFTSSDSVLPIIQANMQDNAASTTIVAIPTNGTLVNAGNTSASSVSGPGGSLPLALTFDGTNDQLNFSSVPATGTACTYLLWVKLNGSQSAYDGLIGARGSSPNYCGMLIGDTGGRELGYNWNNSGSTYSWNSGVNLPNGSWCMAAVAISSANAKVYVFVPGSVTTATNTFTHVSNQFCQNPKVMVDNSNCPIGAACGFRVYNVTLSQADLQAIYDSILPATATLSSGSLMLTGVGK